jgi:hypothetical protein
LERAYWQAMGAGEDGLPSSVSRSTPGQVTWFYLNRILDGEERERKVHLRCLPKLKEVRCEVCGELVDLLRDYADVLSDKVYSPREYIEHQLNMTEDEKQARTVFFEEMFAKHNEELLRRRELHP